jgi:quercetin 2,3-dioxygenase
VHALLDAADQGGVAADLQDRAPLGLAGELRVDFCGGPVSDIIIEPEYLDVTLGPDVTWTHPTKRGHTVFAYLFEGGAAFDATGDPMSAGHGTIVLLADGDLAKVNATSEGARFLFVSGKPLHEPIAWGGPIVMNSDEELNTARRELREGTFVKVGA